MKEKKERKARLEVMDKRQFVVCRFFQVGVSLSSPLVALFQTVLKPKGVVELISRYPLLLYRVLSSITSVPLRALTAPSNAGIDPQHGAYRLNIVLQDGSSASRRGR